jgi:hypothetical protein
MANDKKGTEPTKTEDQKAATPAPVVSPATAEIEALKAENVELRTAIEKLSGSLQLVTAKVTVIEAHAVNKEDAVDDLNLSVAKLSKANEKLTKGPVDMPNPITVNKTKYRFAIPAVKYNGKKITAQDVADNKDLAAELVAQGSGMLVEV